MRVETEDISFMRASILSLRIAGSSPLIASRSSSEAFLTFSRSSAVILSPSSTSVLSVV